MVLNEELQEALAEVKEQQSRLSIGLLGVGGKVDTITERDGGMSVLLRGMQYGKER